MADLIAYSIGDDGNYLTIDGTDGAYSGYAKLFYVPTGYNKVTSISFKLKRQNDPEGAVAEIYAISEPSYLPTGEPIASESLPELTTEYAWHSIDFNVNVSSETWYAAVIRSTAAWEPLHYMFWVGQPFPPDDDNVGGEPEYYNLVWQNEVGDVFAQIKVYGESGLPGKPTLVSPTPTGVTGITLDETPLEWAAGDPAGDTYDVYFRVQGNDWTKVSSAQEALLWTIVFGTLGYGITYEWRVDATNDAGTTTGDTWSFTCMVFDPPLPTGVTLDADGNPTGTATGLNNMMAVRRLVAAARNKIFYEAYP